MSDDARASHAPENADAPDPWAPPDSAGSPAPGAHTWASPAGVPGGAGGDVQDAVIPGSSVPAAPQDTVIAVPGDAGAPTLPGGAGAGGSVHEQATVAGVPAVPVPAPAPGAFGSPGAPGSVPPPGGPAPVAASVGFPGYPGGSYGGAGGGAVPPPPIGPEGPGQVPYGYPPYPVAGGSYGGAGYGVPQGGPGGYPWGAMPLGPQNGLSTASLVLGIISLVIFCLWPVAIILGVLAVILGFVGRRRAKRGESTNPGQALAGIICGAVGVVLGVTLVVLLFTAWDGSDSDSDEDPWPTDDGYSTSLTVSAVR